MLRQTASAQRTTPVLNQLAGKLGTSVALALHAAAKVVLVAADNRAKAKKLALAMRLRV